MALNHCGEELQMSRTAQGGTKKFCPSCCTITVCAAVNPSNVVEQSGQRWYNKDHPDLQWFRRGLVCQECNHRWLTAEVNETFLDELVELRGALASIKKNAERYILESEKASKSLGQLSEALGVLGALKLYKQEE